MIKGVSNIRRLPRLGKIRLGERTEEGQIIENHHFVVPQEVAAIYGDKPIFLDIILPSEDDEVIFSQFMKLYTRTGGIMCRGNGETATFYNPTSKQMEEKECPCEKAESGNCRRKANLLVMLPKVNMGGVYQIDTPGINSIININSAISKEDGFIRSLCGRISFIPLTLARVEKECQYIDKEGALRRKPHWPMQIFYKGNLEDVAKLRAAASNLTLVEYKLETPAETPERKLPEDIKGAPFDVYTPGQHIPSPTDAQKTAATDQGHEAGTETGAATNQGAHASASDAKDQVAGVKSADQEHQQPAQKQVDGQAAESGKTPKTTTANAPTQSQLDAIQKMANVCGLDMLAAIANANIHVKKVEELTYKEATAVIKALNREVERVTSDKSAGTGANGDDKFTPPAGCVKNAKSCTKVFFSSNNGCRCGDIVGPLCPFSK